MKKIIFSISLLILLALEVCAKPDKKIIDDGGSGSFKAEAISEPTLENFVVYRPVDLQEAVKKEGPLPLFVFANGACDDTSLPHERMLNDLASYGYLVVALGEMQDSINDRELHKSPNIDMIRAIDWAEKVTVDSSSPYFKTIDLEYIGIGGMSCGGAQAMANCSDPRVKTVIMFNSGMGDMEMSGASRKSLDNLHCPILYVIGGESDIAHDNAQLDYQRIGNVPVAFANHADIGHGGTYHQQYGGSFSKMARAWLNWQFKDKRSDLDVFLFNRLRDFPDFTMKAKNFPELVGVPALETEMPKGPRKRPEWKFDAQNPDVHDPVMAKEDGVYYMFTTGMGIGMMSSTDLKEWKQEKAPLDPIPAWASELVPAYRGHTWAPDIIKVGDNWYLYYSCSTFGKNISAIGVATNKTLNPNSPDYKWTDLGMVIRSQPGVNDWNAIDPNIVIDENGTPWMTFGSFWDGIQLVQLADDMKTTIGEPVTIARRRPAESVAHGNETANTNAIEAPFIVYHDGWYYLFVSYDFCCKGLTSNYKTAVGRSRSITGPYVDEEGNAMTECGGEVLVAASPEYSGVGHCSVYNYDGKWYFVAHAYDKSKRGASKLFLRELHWKDGWPTL